MSQLQRHYLYIQTFCLRIRIGNDTICATNKARLLGVLLSTDLTFDQHVTSVSGSASTSCVNSTLFVSR